MKTQIPCSQNYCRGCTLEKIGRKLGTEIVYSDADASGTPRVDILVVTEFPNRTEHDNATVVATKGGWEIRMALQAAGLGDRVAYTNLVRCRPLDRDSETREPSIEEQMACANHLWEDIQRLQPKVVVTLGQLATRALVPYERWHSHSIQEIAGETYTHKGVTFFPIPSPYLWAFDTNPYPHRKRLRKLVHLLSQVVTGYEHPYSKKGSTYYCETLDDVRIALRRIRALNPKLRPYEWGVGLDTEGQNVNRVAENGLSCIQFGISDDLAYVVPIDHHDSPWTPEEREKVIGWLRDLFSDPNLGIECWVAHEDKFDLNQILRWLGLKAFAKPTVDPIFLEYLDDENMRATSDGDDGAGADSFRSSFNLKTLLLYRCNFRHYDPEILKIRVQPEGFWKLPMRPSAYPEGSPEYLMAHKFLGYCGMDAYGPLRLAKTQRAEMESRGYHAAYKLALMWGSRVTHFSRAMERNGVEVDMHMLEFLRGPQSPILARVDSIPDEIYESAECQEANRRLMRTDKRTAGMQPLFGQNMKLFDIRKKDHLVSLFVDVCGLEPVEKPSELKNGQKPAIDRHFYAKHDYHPLVQLMQEYTGLFKLKSSYTTSVHNYLTNEKYPDNRFDGRLHASFSKTKTFTGRLASASPSIHQIPRGDNFAKQCIKSLIGAQVGYCIIEADYGQAEVRWWAQISQDEDFIQMFWNMWEIQEEYYRNPTPENRKRKEFECDVHRQVAALMFGVSIADVTKEQRQAAKSIVFGCIYGQSAKALAQILKVTEQYAAELQLKFIGRFKKAGPWLTWIEEEARRLGYVEAPNGRRRHLGPLFDIDEGGTKRQARNSPIQAIASDVMAEAVYLQQRWIEDRNYDTTNAVRIVNTVHDAVLQETRLDIDLIRDVIHNTGQNMMHNVVPVLERDYGFKMRVPMVADFKMGLRWGHAEEWDRGEDLQHTFDHMVQQTQRLEQGEPFWHIAVEEGRVTAAKDEKKAVAEYDKAQDMKEKSKANSKLLRIRKHIAYLDRFGNFA